MAPPDKILASWGPGETRLAVLEGDDVIELALARPGMLAGAVILGRITAAAPVGNSVFVDIGTGQAAFLASPPKVGAKRSEGQAVLVQVRGDAAHGKGATLGLDLAFPGRLLAYTPTKPGIAISRRLPDDVRETLHAALAPLLQEGEGVSIRTAAAAATPEQLAQELSHLRQHWQQVQDLKAQARAPAVLWCPDPIDRVLALYPGITEVRVDDAATFAALRQRLDQNVHLDRDGSVAEIIENALEEATNPCIHLCDGGRVQFGALAALTAIDVDSGGGSVPAANSQAVRAIARHLRLRSLGGQMVIDFIPSGGKGGLTNLTSQLRRLVSTDPVNTAVLGCTAMGLVEVTRERRGPSIPELCCETALNSAPLNVGLRALRQVLAEAPHRPATPLTLSLASEVAAALNSQGGSALKETRERLGGQVLSLRSVRGQARDEILIAQE